MATILDFKASAEVSPKTPKLRLRGRVRSAEIVIFPGIRYERWADDTAATSQVREPDLRKIAD